MLVFGEVYCIWFNLSRDFTFQLDTSFLINLRQAPEYEAYFLMVIFHNFPITNCQVGKHRVLRSTFTRWWFQICFDILP